MEVGTDSTFSNNYHFLLFLIPFGFAISAFGGVALQPQNFLTKQTLENDLKSFCLKQSVLDVPAQIYNSRSATTQAGKSSLESIAFQIARKGAGVNDCEAARDLVQVVGEDNKKMKLFDSGFYTAPNCDSPVRILQSPLIFDIQELGSQTPVRRLAVLEYASSTLPCADTKKIQSRRFLFFDLEDSNKLLLDVEADFIGPEFASTELYRVNLEGVKKVLEVSGEKGPAGQLPSAIELRSGRFVINWQSYKKIDSATKSQSPRTPGETTLLNAIYSKDKKHVYYKTVDESGLIENADPKTFQLLNSNDESAYTKDANGVYFFGKRVPSADPKTFVQLNERYGKDVRHVFHMKSILPGADLLSFTAPFQNIWYAKDKNHVFSGPKIIEKADPLTFSTGDDRSCGMKCSYRSEDKNFRFGADDRIVQRVVVP